jgi:hypothetical protein
MLTTAVNKVKSNPIASILGAGLTFVAVKKYTSINQTWKVVALTVLGGVASAYLDNVKLK